MLSFHLISSDLSGEWTVSVPSLQVPSSLSPSPLWRTMENNRWVESTADFLGKQVNWMIHLEGNCDSRGNGRKWLPYSFHFQRRIWLKAGDLELELSEDALQYFFMVLIMLLPKKVDFLSNETQRSGHSNENSWWVHSYGAVCTYYFKDSYLILTIRVGWVIDWLIDWLIKWVICFLIWAENTQWKRSSLFWILNTPIVDLVFAFQGYWVIAAFIEAYIQSEEESIH